VNGESNESNESFVNENEQDERDRANERERMRELGRRSGAARRLKRELRERGEASEPGGSSPSPAGEQLTDRESALRALRRALDGNNMAAMVAGAKALIEFDTSDPRSRQAISTEDLRDKMIAKIEAMGENQADALASMGICPCCERPVSRAEAETLMAKHRGESYMGWLARLTWKPVPAHGGPADGGNGAAA
jgi:hypothetical protein